MNTIITLKNQKKLLNGNGKLITKEDFAKGIDISNQGFEEGGLIAEEYINDATTLQTKIDRVFSGIHKKFDSLKKTDSFLMKTKNNKYTFDLFKYYNHSVEVGKYVKCWDYILNNHSLFIEIFNTFYKSILKKNPPISIQCQEQTIINDFKNNFDEVSEEKVQNYFKEQLVDKKYLDQKTLDTFLILAFEKKKLPQEKFTFLKIRTKKVILKIFYHYYHTIAQKPYGRIDDYIKLLTDNFSGFDFQKTKNNFSKSSV